MPGTLTTLVRLARHKVEKAQEALAVAEKNSLRLAQWLQSTEAARLETLNRATGAEDVASHLDAGWYDARLKQTVEKLRVDLQVAEVEAQRQRQALTLVYAEQERYVLLLTQEDQKIAKRRADKQQQALDEVAGQGLRRRES